MIDKNNINSLYGGPFPSTRTGALFNAFSYPTKISPEAIALFIACHTKPGERIFDPFGGSGTTGIATKLCDNPTQAMLDLAEKTGSKPVWGPREAVIYELSPVASAIGATICNTDPDNFSLYATDLLNQVETDIKDLYRIKDDKGEVGTLRHIIWTDIIKCPNCKNAASYADVAIHYNPISFIDECTCHHCGASFKPESAERVLTDSFDPILGETVKCKSRAPFKIYGTTGKRKWCRHATEEDYTQYQRIINSLNYSDVPKERIKWGDLYRSGYHFGINYIHQLYSFRNAFVLSQLLKKVESYPQDIQSALKVFILSYNQSHSTLMTRVVAKKGNKDFVLTGAQSGVMYISSLPVEKNIIEGLKRKIKTFRDAIDLVNKSQSRVQFVNGSSINTILADNSIDYVFTDPPFGDYIPYSEINQINEIWYGEKTNSTDEVIINHNQKKGTNEYSSLMTSVFSEVYRCLKTKGLCTVVFHSAKAEIWRSIITAYQIAGLSILKTGILDKVQASFKQVNSSITVKGDPLLLLTKSTEIRQTNNIDDKIVAAKIIERHSHEANCKEKSEIMFSEFIGECIEQGITITLNANYFFKND